jgi:hypothetical protein
VQFGGKEAFSLVFFNTKLSCRANVTGLARVLSKMWRRRRFADRDQKLHQKFSVMKIEAIFGF